MSITDIVLNEFTGNSGIFPTPVNQNFERLKDGILTRYEDVRSDLDEISTVASGALPKSGGTMTGNLAISKGSHPYLYLTNTAETAGTSPSVNMYKGVVFQAKGQGQTKEVGQVGNTYYVSGARSSFLSSTKADGTGKAEIRVGFDASGNEFFSFPKCTTAASTTSSATSNLVAVIVKNYKNGASWYRVWSDGWIEQGGNAKNGTTVSLIKNFTTTNYTVVATKSTTTYDDNFELLSITSKTTSGFYLSQSGFTYGIYANWYACGY